MTNLNINLGGKISIRKRHPKIRRNCLNCGKEFWVWQARIKIGKGKFCSTRCGKIGSNNPSWRGGFKYIYGYKFILKRDHPGATEKGYVKEHHLVMEDYLGRYLKEGETVHHKNGVRDDNRIENLLLLSNQSEHMKIHRPKKGQKWVSFKGKYGS